MSLLRPARTAAPSHRLSLLAKGMEPDSADPGCALHARSYIRFRMPGRCTSFLVGTLLLGGGAAMAQRNTVATGTEATGTGGTMSYTIGQVDHMVVTSAGGTVAQGVQQPYEFLVLPVEGIHAPPALSVSPNPTVDGILLQLASTPTGDMSYRLLGQNGALIRSARLTDERTAVPMADLPAAVYTIVVLDMGRPTSTIKIIKH